ncbi:tail protein [Synechococcus phage S-CBS2]|uniref:tail protein n=1 Tax=Synechococcus phage S-CBS2 TaxID=753084 RepID=UPI00020783EC|nr:tail protein [Synechococcus phage S-CBS2]ADF42375.1 unknown structural protein [Synechococcus phage S-CBS2]
MANYSAAFGYDCYIIPLASASVDTTFTGVTGGVGDGATNFIDTTTVVAADEKVTYAAGVFSLGATPVAEPTDGTMNPVKLFGLTNASLETDTNSEDVLTYDDTTKGFNTSIATSKSWSVSLAGVADFKDAGYQILRITEQNTVADSLRVKFARVGPTGTVETVYGYGTLTGYTESIEAGSIVSWESSIVGYGPYVIEIDENAGN